MLTNHCAGGGKEKRTMMVVASGYIALLLCVHVWFAYVINMSLCHMDQMTGTEIETGSNLRTWMRFAV